MPVKGFNIIVFVADRTLCSHAESRKQRPAVLERPNYATPSMAKTGSQQGSQQGGSQR